MASIYTINSSTWITLSPRHQCLLPKWLYLALFVVLIAAVAVQSLSHVWLFATPWTAACQASLSFTISWSLLRFTTLLPPSLPAFNLSQHQGLFQRVSSFLRWSKCWSFSFRISLSNAYSGLISFRIRLVWSPCSPTDRQESSLQSESISSLVLNPLYGPTLSFSQSCSVMSESFRPHGLLPTRLLCPWSSPGRNTEVGSHSLLQGTFPTQGSNPCPTLQADSFTVWATKETHGPTLWS